MKNYLLLAICLITQYCFSQERKDSFIGEIQVETYKVFEDKELYLENVKKYLKVLDSIYTDKYLENLNEEQTTKYPTLKSYLDSVLLFFKIALNPDFTSEDWTKKELYRYLFADSKIMVITPSRSTFQIDRNTLEFKGKKRLNEDLIEVPLMYRFNDVPIEELIIDKKDTKVVAGIECYKVTVIQKGERIVRHFYWNNIKDAKVITEMYVTDEIDLLFHLTIKNKPILNKFYPMYVKRYSTAFTGMFLISEVTKVEFRN